MEDEFFKLLSEYIEYTESKWPALGEPTLMGFYEYLKKKRESE